MPISTNEQHEKTRRQIRKQTAEYLAKCGNIEYLPAPHCELNRVRIDPNAGRFIQ